MDEEILLALKNAEMLSKQHRSLRYEHTQKPTTANLMDGLLPYMAKDGKLNHFSLSNNQLLSSFEPFFKHDSSDDIDVDFDLIQPDDSAENEENIVFEEDEVLPVNNIVILDELFSSKSEQNLLTFPYTNITMNEFCFNLVCTFRNANLCKIYSSEILKFMHSALSQPNYLPNSMNSLLNSLQGNHKFRETSTLSSNS